MRVSWTTRARSRRALGITALVGCCMVLAALGLRRLGAGVATRALAAPAAAERVARPDPRWRQSKLWDDGTAEFCAYEVAWARYGHIYPGRALLVLVKEPWAPDLDVKADQPRPDGFDVLKLNSVRDVPTGIYTYHQMASVYFRRENAALQKLAATSSEACGISTALFRRGRLETHSYFDGQGDRTQAYPARALPEDGLPALLRDFVEGAPPESLLVFPSLLMGRFEDLGPQSFGVHKAEVSSIEVPAGTFTGIEIRLVRGGTFLAYTFEATTPHRLLRLQRDDGTEYRLAKGERIPYWTMHDPGGEAWLPEKTR